MGSLNCAGEHNETKGWEIGIRAKNSPNLWRIVLARLNAGERASKHREQRLNAGENTKGERLNAEEKRLNAKKKHLHVKRKSAETQTQSV